MLRRVIRPRVRSLDGRRCGAHNPPEVGGTEAGPLECRVLSAIGDAVVVTDPSGRVTVWAGAAESVFGRSSEEVLGRGLLEVLGGPVDPVEAITLGGAETAELVVPLDDGRPAAVSVRALRDPSGTLTGTIAQV